MTTLKLTSRDLLKELEPWRTKEARRVVCCFDAAQDDRMEVFRCLTQVDVVQSEAKQIELGAVELGALALGNELPLDTDRPCIKTVQDVTLHLRGCDANDVAQALGTLQWFCPGMRRLYICLCGSASLEVLMELEQQQTLSKHDWLIKWHDFRIGSKEALLFLCDYSARYSNAVRGETLSIDYAWGGELRLLILVLRERGIKINNIAFHRTNAYMPPEVEDFYRSAMTDVTQ